MTARLNLNILDGQIFATLMQYDYIWHHQPANDRRRYTATPSHIAWAPIQNDPWLWGILKNMGE